MIRLFKASSFHPAALRMHYDTHPELASAPFCEQWRSLTTNLLVGTDFWGNALNASGRFVAFETVINCLPLQTAWARENGIPGGDLLQVLLAQIERFHPEVLFTHDFEILNPAFRSEARRRCASIRLIFGWDGIARNDPAHFAGCDLILSCIPHVVSKYKSYQIESELLQYSFNSVLLTTLKERSVDVPLSFAGSVQLKSKLHFQRADSIYRVLRELPIELHLTGSVERWKWLEREQRRRLRHFRFREAWVTHELGRANAGALFGLDLVRFLSRSGVTLNMHIDAAKGQASNMRLFEATGAGACLLTDWQSDLARFFEPDTEVATYKSADELVEKAAYLMNHERERESIAAAGRARTLREHTFEHRIPLIEDILMRRLKSR